MEKIPTIFKRDWEGNRGVLNEYIAEDYFVECLNRHNVEATEKLDGTNVRLTIRSGTLVRLEKRHNPSRLQKERGIEEPWYEDTDENDPQDKWIWDAARNTHITDIADGEYSGEAIGKNIQGNPLGLDHNTVFLFSIFSIRERIVFSNVPTTYAGLKEWLPKQKSRFNSDCGIEGIVWWLDGRPLGKIKLRDFK